MSINLFSQNKIPKKWFLEKKTSTKKKKKRDNGTQPMVHTAGGINKTFPRVLKNSFGGKMTDHYCGLFSLL